MCCLDLFSRRAGGARPGRLSRFVAFLEVLGSDAGCFLFALDGDAVECSSAACEAQKPRQSCSRPASVLCSLHPLTPQHGKRKFVARPMLGCRCSSHLRARSFGTSVYSSFQISSKTNTYVERVTKIDLSLQPATPTVRASCM